MKSQIVETVTIAQAAHTLRQTAQIYFSKDRRGHYRMERRRARPICLMGPSGIGKTEIVRQVAEEQGLAFLSYSITHHTRQSIIGLPRLTQMEVDGRLCSVTEYTMSEIIAQIYRTMAESGKEEGILFLDEFNCASESLRPILLQLLQDKTFGPHRIPDGWMLVLAGNPAEYNRSASNPDPVTADRLRLVHIKPDYPAWRDYMVGRAVHPVVLSYLDSHRDHFYLCRHTPEGTALTTARGWEDLSHMLLFLEQEEQQPDLPLIAQYIQAAEVARSFFGYYTQHAALARSGILEQVLAQDPKAIRTIRKMSFERSWNLVGTLIHRLQTEAQQARELDTTTAGVHACLKDIREQLSPDCELDTLLLRAAEAVGDQPVRAFLTDCVDCTRAEDGWTQIKVRFDRQLRQPRTEAYQKAATQIENVIRVCRAALEGKPHLEFLFRCLCENEAITDVLACHPNPEFRSLLKDVCFSPEDEGAKLMEEIVGTDDPKIGF